MHVRMNCVCLYFGLLHEYIHTHTYRAAAAAAYVNCRRADHHRCMCECAYVYKCVKCRNAAATAEPNLSETIITQFSHNLE